MFKKNHGSLIHDLLWNDCVKISNQGDYGIKRTVTVLNLVVNMIVNYGITTRCA